MNTVPPPPATREQALLERMAADLAAVKALLGVVAMVAVFAFALAVIMIIA